MTRYLVKDDGSWAINLDAIKHLSVMELHPDTWVITADDVGHGLFYGTKRQCQAGILHLASTGKHITTTSDLNEAAANPGEY